MYVYEDLLIFSGKRIGQGKLRGFCSLKVDTSKLGRIVVHSVSW